MREEDKLFIAIEKRVDVGEDFDVHFGNFGSLILSDVSVNVLNPQIDVLYDEHVMLSEVKIVVHCSILDSDDKNFETTPLKVPFKAASSPDDIITGLAKTLTASPRVFLNFFGVGIAKYGELVG